MKHYLFELSMPRVNSWNGKWSSGIDRRYLICRSFTNRDAEGVEAGRYTYDFGDGWVAMVEVTEIKASQKAGLIKQSVGFCGYGWMVDSIIRYGEILNAEQRREREEGEA